MRFLKFCIVCLFAAAVLACANTSEPNTAANNSARANTQSSPAAASQTTPARAEIADGRRLYTDNCAGCHKENGTGGKKMIDGKEIDAENLTTDKIKKFSDDKIAGYIKNGVEDEGMPAFRDKLDDKQIAAIVAYIRSDLQKVQPGS